MQRRLAFDLHLLTARMDRVADRLLATEYALSYRRFLVLLTLRELQSSTQRQLAEQLGVSEPSVSRMVGLLAQDGLLDLRPDPQGGNRKRLTLSAAGSRLVQQCEVLLEQRFAALLELADVPYDEYAARTRNLLQALEETDT